MQIKNANINSALETKSNANSVHEGNSDSSRYATPEPADGIDYNNVEEAMNQLVPDTFDKFDNSSDLIDLNNVYEDNMECRNNSHDIDLNTHKQIKFYDKPNNINKNESLIESNNRLKSDMSNSDLQIVSRGKPSNIDNIKNKESESHDLTNRDKESLNNHSGIVSVSKSYVSASLSVRRYLSNQNNCSTNTSASTVGLLSYEATASPEPELGDGPIPELEEDRVHRIITQASHDQSSPENHGRLSRNSNISCVSSEALAMVEQMLNKCNENIEQTNQKLSETLADIEVKELNVPRTNLTHGTKPLIEVKELNVPRTESSQVLNNNQMSQDKNNLMMKSYNNGERIVNRLKSPIPHVQALKNTNYKTNSDSNPSTSNQYKINSEHRPSSTNQISPNIPNTKQYISHIEYDPSKCTTNHFNSTSYPTNDNSPTYETNEKEDKTLSGIDENLNENLLVSSSESSARRGKLPPIMKKPPQRKPVKENLNTILTKMPVNEMEKQKMIEQFVHNSLQQAKQSGNLVNDDNNAYDTIRHRNNVRQEFCRTEQTSVHSESRRDNKGQGSNEQSQEYFEDEKSSEKRLNDLGGNKNVLYDSNLSQDLLPDYIDVNQLEPKDQARLNNQLETKVQDRMPNDQDKMIKYQKRLLMDDQDRLIENENGISPYNNNNNHMESKEEDIMPEDQDRAAKDHNRMPLSEELAVKKKTSYRGRPRKYSKYADDPAGPSLKSLAQKRNIFECLKQTSNSNSADVSSEETSSDVPSKVRSSKTKPHKTEQQPNTLQNNTADKSNPGTLSTTSNTAHKLNSSGITNSKDNAAPRSSPSPSRVSNASSQSFITHKPGHKSEEAASRSKTQKWFWLTLQQETLLKSKAGKTIKVRVMRIPAVGEFYCQPVGVFPEYELGFKTLFFNSNTPQVYSQFKPMTSIRPGKLVMVCDPNSNKWYRSEVQDKVEGQDLFKVFFVDFGTEAFVPGNSIREIQPDYTQIPYQAIHCQLNNISVCPNAEFVESEDYIKYLKVWSDMLRVGQTHEVKIMEVDSNLVRVTLEDSGGFDMGELLALSCSTPFVELKSNRLQGAWTDYVFDYCE
uniref:Tudor domain-containing protein n=2 Tax=Cacopsylla melanoneura TaxID=428564 RepID=A0A8D9E2M5_9HEMI